MDTEEGWQFAANAFLPKARINVFGKAFARHVTGISDCFLVAVPNQVSTRQTFVVTEEVAAKLAEVQPSDARVKLQQLRWHQLCVVPLSYRNRKQKWRLAGRLYGSSSACVDVYRKLFAVGIGQDNSALHVVASWPSDPWP